MIDFLFKNKTNMFQITNILYISNTSEAFEEHRNTVNMSQFRKTTEENILAKSYIIKSNIINHIIQNKSIAVLFY